MSSWRGHFFFWEKVLFFWGDCNWELFSCPRWRSFGHSEASTILERQDMEKSTKIFFLETSQCFQSENPRGAVSLWRQKLLEMSFSVKLNFERCSISLLHLKLLISQEVILQSFHFHRDELSDSVTRFKLVSFILIPRQINAHDFSLRLGFVIVRRTAHENEFKSILSKI